MRVGIGCRRCSRLDRRRFCRGRASSDDPRVSQFQPSCGNCVKGPISTTATGTGNSTVFRHTDHRAGYRLQPCLPSRDDHVAHAVTPAKHNVATEQDRQDLLAGAWASDWHFRQIIHRDANAHLSRVNHFRSGLNRPCSCHHLTHCSLSAPNCWPVISSRLSAIRFR